MIRSVPTPSIVCWLSFDGSQSHSTDFLWDLCFSTLITIGTFKSAKEEKEEGEDGSEEDYDSKVGEKKSSKLPSPPSQEKKNTNTFKPLITC